MVAMLLLAIAAVLIIIGAAPVDTVRQTPSGIKLDDGFPTKIAFNRLPNVAIWEITVKPTGIDGGEAIETTNMHNLKWRTMAARKLVTLTESTIKFAYDPKIKQQIQSLINKEGSITEWFPDGSKLSYFGYLRTVDFDDNAEGTRPEGTATITPTNWDPVNRVEADPVLTEVAGT